MSIENEIASYKIAAKAAGFSDRHIDHVCLSVKLFAESLGGIPDVRKVTAEDLQRFIVLCQNRPTWHQNSNIKTRRKMSTESIRSYVKAIKAFWSWLEKERIIKSNPLKAVPLPKQPQRLPKTLSEDEVKAILTAIEHKIKEVNRKLDPEEDTSFPSALLRDKAIFMLLVDTGLRASELCNLKWQDWNVESGELTVIGKGNRQRTVPLSAPVQHAILQYHLLCRPANEGFYLFSTKDGKKLTKDRVLRIVQKLAKLAKIERKISTHMLRHTAATLNLKYSNNIEYTRRLLGHSRLSTTQIYVHLAQKDINEVHKSASPVVRLGVK